MSRHPHRRTVLRASLAACTLGMWPAARACEFFAGHLRVSHPWTRATVAGATTAVLCMRIDEVQEADRLVGARTPVATGVEMGGPEAGRPVDLPIAEGSVLELFEEGTHLRLTGLQHGLQVGREYPLHLEFERAGLVLARLSVDFTAMRFR